MPEPQIFASASFAIAIDAADIDFMGHVNNASYLKWVQEAVINHWQRASPRRTRWHRISGSR